MINYYPRVVIDCENNKKELLEDIDLIDEQNLDHLLSNHYIQFYNLEEIQNAVDLHISDKIKNLKPDETKQIKIFPLDKIKYIVIILTKEGKKADLEAIHRTTRFKENTLEVQYFIISEKLINVEEYFGKNSSWNLVLPRKLESGRIPVELEYKQIWFDFLLMFLSLPFDFFINCFFQKKPFYKSGSIMTNRRIYIKFIQDYKDQLKLYIANKYFTSIIDKHSSASEMSLDMAENSLQYPFKNLKDRKPSIPQIKIPFFAKKLKRIKYISAKLKQVKSQIKSAIYSFLSPIQEQIDNRRIIYSINNKFNKKMKKCVSDNYRITSIIKFLDNFKDYINERLIRKEWEFIKVKSIDISSYPWNIWWMLLAFIVAAIILALFKFSILLILLPIVIDIIIFLHALSIIHKKNIQIAYLFKQVNVQSYSFLKCNFEKILHTFSFTQLKLLIPIINKHIKKYRILLTNYRKYTNQEIKKPSYNFKKLWNSLDTNLSILKDFNDPNLFMDINVRDRDSFIDTYIESLNHPKAVYDLISQKIIFHKNFRKIMNLLFDAYREKDRTYSEIRDNPNELKILFDDNNCTNIAHETIIIPNSEWKSEILPGFEMIIRICSYETEV